MGVGLRCLHYLCPLPFPLRYSFSSVYSRFLFRFLLFCYFSSLYRVQFVYAVRKIFIVTVCYSCIFLALVYIRLFGSCHVFRFPHFDSSAGLSPFFLSISHRFFCFSCLPRLLALFLSPAAIVLLLALLLFDSVMRLPCFSFRMPPCYNLDFGKAGFCLLPVQLGIAPTNGRGIVMCPHHGGSFGIQSCMGFFFWPTPSGCEIVPLFHFLCSSDIRLVLCKVF